MITDQAAARELLELAIARSGLSAVKFAERVLIRDPRTVRRWLAGDNPIPQAVIAKLEQDMAAWNEASERRDEENAEIEAMDDEAQADQDYLDEQEERGP